MKKRLSILFALCVTLTSLSATEYHIAKSGSDDNTGSASSPFLTIQKAATIAMPGDVITVHEGVYREEVAPFRGGTSHKKRITYQAAKGENVTITGAEVVSGWKRVNERTWCVTLPSRFWGLYNPFATEVSGDWYEPKTQVNHTGGVYINDEWLKEAKSKEDVMSFADNMPLWYAEVERSSTTIWAQFGDADPNKERVEVNVRETVFYPSRVGVDFITLRGFTLCKAATNWAPPTSEQKGLVGTNWSRGWIIEENKISHSMCVGISLGKYGDKYDNMIEEHKYLKLPPTQSYYIQSVDRARLNGWQRGIVGEHIVRNNEISYCEQAGIVGSMGASFSQILDNHIHHINVQKRFFGAEMAGIKFHAPIDMLIKGNRVHDTCLALWLDWMTQGTRVSCNLFYRNGMDLYSEVNHGPYVVDNNIFLSGTSRHLSQGGAFVHNIWGGKLGNWADPRYTPYFEQHSTVKRGDHQISIGDDHFYNNIFIGGGAGANSLFEVESDVKDSPRRFSFGLECYNFRPQLPATGGNLYFNGSKPCKDEVAIVEVGKNPRYTIVEEDNKVYLQFEEIEGISRANNPLVTSALLGKAVVPDAPFEDYDGSPLVIDTDYFGIRRDKSHPAAGPFESLSGEKVQIW